jgi:hypothetical protein
MYSSARPAVKLNGNTGVTPSNGFKYAEALVHLKAKIFNPD